MQARGGKGKAIQVLLLFVRMLARGGWMGRWWAQMGTGGRKWAQMGAGVGNEIGENQWGKSNLRSI